MTHGSALADALVAIALVALGASVIAASAATTTRMLRLARLDAVGTARAVAQVEVLRAGPRVDDVTVVHDADGAAFTTRTTVRDGRGHSTGIDVRVEWADHAQALSTEVLP